MDPVTLSAGLVAVLAPLLPYLTGIGKAAAGVAVERAGKALGEAAVRRSAALWDRLWPQLRGQAPAREAVAAIAEHPDDKGARTALAREVAVLLGGDPELAREAAALIRQVRDRGVAIDVGDIAISGDQNVVQVGEHNISIGGAHNVEIHDRNHP